MLGRHEECALFLDDPRLSRRHARLIVGFDSLQIEDLGSVNGVHLNGTKVQSLTSCSNGDQLVIGPFTFEVEIEPDSEPPSRIVGSLLDADLSSDLEFEPSTDRYRTAADKNGDDTNPVPFKAPDPSEPPSEGSQRPDSAAIYDEPLTPHPNDPHGQHTDGDQTSRIARNPFTEIDESEKTPAQAAKLEPGTADEAKPGTVTGLDGRKLNPQSNPRVTAALMPRDHASHIRNELRECRSARLAAGFLDVVSCQAVALVFGLPCVIGGYVVALAQVKAGIVGGEPMIHPSLTPAPVWDLITTSLSWQGLTAAPEIINLLREEYRSAFLLFFIGATVAVLAWVMVVISMLVAATMIKGAPFWHRRFNLVIKERQTGFYPSPMRSAARWFLVGLLGWMSPLFIALALPSPHDEITRCWVRRNTKKPDPEPGA